MSSGAVVGAREVSLFAHEVISGRASKEEVKRFLREMRERGERAQDLVSLALAFREAEVPVPTRHPVVADLCGTGGGSMRTINASTISSFVVAGAGVPVAKHGNRTNGGMCGSADLMEALGVPTLTSPGQASWVLDAGGMAFLFAPAFHPAMRHAAEARRELGGRTVFNALGPLLNPALAKRRQLLGVHSPSLLEPVAQAAGPLGIDRALVVHGAPGMDEVSTLGPTLAILVRDGGLERLVIEPGELGVAPPSPEDLGERGPRDSAALARRVLAGLERGACRDLVLINSAAALLAYGRVGDMEQGMRIAARSIDSGAAYRKLHDLTVLSRLAPREA